VHRESTGFTLFLFTRALGGGRGGKEKKKKKKKKEGEGEGEGYWSVSTFYSLWKRDLRFNKTGKKKKRGKKKKKKGGGRGKKDSSAPRLLLSSSSFNLQFQGELARPRHAEKEEGERRGRERERIFRC